MRVIVESDVLLVEKKREGGSRHAGENAEAEAYGRGRAELLQ